MLSKRFYEVMEKYKEQKIIASQDKRILEILVHWGLCNIHDSQAKLNYKGNYQLQCYYDERKKTLLSKLFDLFR